MYIYINRLYTYKYTYMCMCVFGERESFPMVCFYFIGMYPRHNIAVFHRPVKPSSDIPLFRFQLKFLKRK